MREAEAGTGAYGRDHPDEDAVDLAEAALRGSARELGSVGNDLLFSSFGMTVAYTWTLLITPSVLGQVKWGRRDMASAKYYVFKEGNRWKVRYETAPSTIIYRTSPPP